MEKPFNKLDPSQVERLAILIEECSEVQHIACKILRHGYDSHNPNDESKIPNKELLEIELGDLTASIGFLTLDDVCQSSIEQHSDARIQNIGEYMHHNQIVDDK